MADEVRYAGKHLLHSGQDAFAHIVDQRDGFAVLRLDSLEKRDEKLLLLRRNFDAVQDEVGQLVQAAKQVGAAPLAGAVHMQDVSASFLHSVADFFSGLSMGMRQIGDEFLSQEGNLASRDGDVFVRQLIDDFSHPQTPNKQRPAHMDNDIESESAVVRYESAQLRRAVDIIVTAAIQTGLLCREGTDVQSDDSFRLSLLYL